MSNSTEMYTNLIEESLRKRNNITSENIKQLEKMYSDLSKELVDKASKAKGGFTKAWLKDYSKFLQFKAEQLHQMQLDIISGAIQEGARISASVEGDFYTYINGKYNLDIPKEMLDYAYSVNDDVIGLILNGGFYKDNRSLSERIWRNVNGSMQDIQYILTTGMASGKSYLEIIKDLEKHVNPNAKKPWDFRKVYPGLRSRKIDYNAQRLLRTSITQMYQLESTRKARENPFVTKAKWNLSSEHYSRQVQHFGPDICDEYAGKFFNLNDVPLQHPQCLCYITYEIPKNMDQIAKEIKNWIDGEANPRINRWASLAKNTKQGNNENNNKKQETKKTESKKPERITYSAYKTKNGVNGLLRKVFGEKSSYGDISVDCANGFNKGAIKMLDLFPEIQKAINSGIGTTDKKGSYAFFGASVKGADSKYYYTNTFIKLSSLVHKDLETYNKSAERDMQSNFHSQRTSSLHGTMAHELMHSLEFYVLAHRYGGTGERIPAENFKKVVEDSKNHVIADEIVNRAFANLGFKEDDYEKFKARRKVLDELGKYSSTTRGELIAEAMSDYVTSDKPLDFSVEVVKEMRKMLDQIKK